MSKLTKKQKDFAGKVDSNKLYALTDALTMVKECATAKFDESIDVAVQLGIDAKKSDQVVRGAVVLPNGTGKTARVAVFAQGAKAGPGASGLEPFFGLFGFFFGGARCVAVLDSRSPRPQHAISRHAKTRLV
jgi:hypothetical protein